VAGKQASSDKQEVRKRQVFYIPGYDPMLPRRYRELYRSEGALQAEISGYSLDLKGNPKGDTYSWSVRSTINEQKTDTEFAFLLWSDIVQSSMDRSIPATFLLLARVVWIYLRTGALRRLTRLRKGPVIAALYPVFMLSLQVLLAIGLGLIVGTAINAFAPFWLAIGAGLAALGWLMVWFRRLDNKFFAYYLLHDYAFSAQYYGANPPELQARMQEFGERIFQALKSDVDEVLVVGHSSGAHLGVSVLAELLRRHDLDPKGPKLGFLTLGHVVPMVSFLPKADQLRADLNYLCQQDRLSWVDVTAPGDGCTFALCDPVGVSGVAPETGQIWPLVFSAAFTQSLSPEFYDTIKRRYFRLHFQYLCAFDRPLDYDYFQITAGPVTLASRFQGRAPSPSVIATAHSPHTGMAKS
jgi:hypothetical protein